MHLKRVGYFPPLYTQYRVFVKQFCAAYSFGLGRIVPAQWPLIPQYYTHVSKEKELDYDYEQSCFVLGR